MFRGLLTNKKLFYGGLTTAVFYLILVWLLDRYRYLAPEYILTSAVLFLIYLTYFLTYQNLRDHGLKASDWQPILIWASVFVALMMLAVPSAYNDFYHYFFEDLVLVKYGQNPYIVTPLDIPTEPTVWLSGWRFLPAQHGPWRSFMTLPAAWFSQGHLLWGLFWYKLTFVAALAGSNLLIYRIAQRIRPQQATLVLLLVSWNPLIIFGTFTGGGTDILMMFWALLAFHLLLKDKIYWAIGALSLSVLIKYVTVLLLPLFLIYFWKKQSTLTAKIKVMLSQLALFGAVTILSFWPFWQGPETLAGIQWVARFFDVNSFPGMVSLMFALANPQLDWYSLKIVFEVAFIGLYSFLLLKFWRTPNIKPSTIIYFSALVLGWFLLLGKFWFYPKYLIWLLPLLFLSDRPLYPLAVFLTGIVAIAPHSSILMPVALVAPTLIFSFYYFLRPQKVKL